MDYGRWKKVFNLCSNNYLGFANNPKVKSSAQKAIETYGVGPAAVRTIAGTTTLHKELERKLALFKGVESTITFQSGFCANLAVIPAIVGEGMLSSLTNSIMQVLLMGVAFLRQRLSAMGTVTPKTFRQRFQMKSNKPETHKRRIKIPLLYPPFRKGGWGGQKSIFG